jgi:hypothetical protein
MVRSCYKVLTNGHMLLYIKRKAHSGKIDNIHIVIMLIYLLMTMYIFKRFIGRSWEYVLKSSGNMTKHINHTCEHTNRRGFFFMTMLLYSECYVWFINFYQEKYWNLHRAYNSYLVHYGIRNLGDLYARTYDWYASSYFPMISAHIPKICQ